jgi:hypothetical protein
VAFSVVVSPTQMKRSAPAETTGNGFTVRVKTDVLVHPVTLVPVTVYVVVDMGDAKILLPVVELNPVAGDQEKTESAPLAVRLTLPPRQMDELGPALTVGNGFTFTLTVSVCEHPFPSVPVTM